jgi:hypothetical protein
MDPLTDKITHVPLPDGRTIEVVQPGALVNPPGSSNWRLTREVFDRYAPFLRTAAVNWPSETSFAVPVGMSPNTFCRALRDARQALLAFVYNEELYNLHLPLATLAVFSLDPAGTSVWFRARGTRGRTKKYTHEVVAHNHRQTEVKVSATPTPDELRAMCVLIKTGRLESPLQFRGRIDEQLISELELKHDVAFVWDDVTDITTLA